MRYNRVALIIAITCLITGYFIHRFLNTRNEIWITLSILVMGAVTCCIALAILVRRDEMDGRPFRRQKARLHRAGYSTYVYKKLDKSDPKSIRLIELIPWTNQDIENGIYVRIKMHTASLDDPNAPAYEAISYCWGDATHLEPIVCNDAVIQVTKSLHRALRRLHLGRSRILWADALCINQTDTEEKNFQVRLMGEVYRHATRVLVYLGDEGLDSGLLKDFVPELARAKDEIAPELQRGDISRRKPLSHERQKELGIPFMTLSHHRHFVALQVLLSRTWFSRVWIIQEIALANDAILLCGDWQIPWDDLVSAFDLTDMLQMSGRHVVKYGVHRLNRLEYSRTDGARHLLEYLLTLHRGAGVTDPRDQVYGLLGLAKDGDLFEVDYSKSVAEVYLDAAKTILLSSSNLKLLHLMVTPQGGRDPLLPSWVPDWRVDLLHEPLADPHVDFKEVHIDFNSNGRILIVRGNLVDAIEMVGVCYPSISYNEYPVVWTHMLWYSSVDKWLDTFSPYFYRPYPIRDVDFSLAFRSLIFEPSYCVDGRQLKYLKSMFRVGRWVSSLPLEHVQLRTLAFLFLFSPVFLLLKWIAQALTWGPKFPVRFSGDLEGRRMMTTKKGYLGLCPESAKEGDQVFIIDGCQTPMVLRRAPANEDGYELIGECSMYKYEAELAEDDAQYHSLALV